MKPTDALARTQALLTNLEDLKRKAVFVGLPSEAVGSEVYGDERSLLANGAVHEYGYGPIPQRSFLRAPFDIKSNELETAIAKQFASVSAGRTDVDTGLGRVGVVAVNISKGAFTSDGYGTWPALAPATVSHKARTGRLQPLVDTGLLRGAITWVIRDGS